MGYVEGKRVDTSGNKPGKKKVILIVIAAVVVLLAAGYLGLCAWAGSGTFWPNTTIAGVNVLDRAGLSGLLVDAVLAADQRGRDMEKE